MAGQRRQNGEGFTGFGFDDKETCLKKEINDEDNVLPDRKWVAQRVQPGSSLGGARPKAGVVDTDKSLYIANFALHKDRKTAEKIISEVVEAVKGWRELAVRIMRFKKRNGYDCRSVGGTVLSLKK